MKPRWEEAGVVVEGLALDSAASDATLSAQLIAATDGHPGDLVLGGFSLGARVAALAAAATAASVLLCFGYPFHPRGAPEVRPGLAALRAVTIPTLVVQGSRDAHGNQQEVAGYSPISPHVHLRWLRDGNHRFRPRSRSGLTMAQHVDDAAIAALEFIRRHQRHDSA